MNAGRSKARTFGILAGGFLLSGGIAASLFPKEAIPLALAGVVAYVLSGRTAMRAWNADRIVFEPPAPPPVITESAVERGLLRAAFGSAALERTRGRRGSRERPARPGPGTRTPAKG
jgi:hypothetical protein